MSNEALISFTGNATGDPELRFTPSGAAVANLTVAVTPREKKGDQWADGEAAFYRVTIWRDPAENVAESIKRGDRVTVVGRLKPREFETKTGKRLSLDVDADSIALDLRFTPAKFASKSSRTAPPTQGPKDRAHKPEPDPWATDVHLPVTYEEPPF